MASYPANQVAKDISLVITELEIEANLLLDRLALEVDKLVSNGVSVTVATTQILNDVKNEVGVYAAWKNTQKRIIRESTKALVAKPVTFIGRQDPAQIFEWVLSGSVKEHCPDCLMLSQMDARTINEWRAVGFGLPREAGTVCNAGCRCLLQPINE